jgi:epsilon-lactone hydrolase
VTEVRHDLTDADRAAIVALRAQLAAKPIAITRASLDKLFGEVPSAESIEYSESSVGCVPGIWCRPKSCRAEAAMLYLHGGVFAYGSARAFCNFVGHIAVRSSVPAFVADYRLAPEHPFPAALEDARAAYGALAAHFGPRHVAVAGDSAGGGLALSVLREQPAAACGVLLSPWTDLALAGESINSKAGDDPILTRAGLEAAVRQYLGDQDSRDPRTSPLYGSTRGTPPIQVHVGTAEILLDDSLRLAPERRVEVHAWEGMPHVFPSSIGLFEAARAAHDLIATFLRTELELP